MSRIIMDKVERTKGSRSEGRRHQSAPTIIYSPAFVPTLSAFGVRRKGTTLLYFPLVFLLCRSDAFQFYFASGPPTRYWTIAAVVCLFLTAPEAAETNDKSVHQSDLTLLDDEIDSIKGGGGTLSNIGIDQCQVLSEVCEMNKKIFYIFSNILFLLINRNLAL